MQHGRYRAVLAVLPALCFWTLIVRGSEPEVRRGEVRFEPVSDEGEAVPEPFRLPAATFEFEQKPFSSAGDVIVSTVTFPSPVVTPHPNNNTVHCEYFRPAKPGKYPACIVLHILGGDFPLSRAFAYNLAQRGVCALFLKMPYYGERRQPGVQVRMVSIDADQTVRGMTQAVKDIRYARTWLAAQDEVDSKRLGVFGISLGGITAALAGAAEPRFARICPVLAGGDMERVLRESQERHLVRAREKWTSAGRTIDELGELMKTVDPCTYGHCINGRKVLMLNARNDEVIPPACTESLWEAFGCPPIHWYDVGHYSAMLYIVDAMEKVGDFFASPN